MNHREKLRLARRMGSKLRMKGQMIFDTLPWMDRKRAIAKRVAKTTKKKHD